MCIESGCACAFTVLGQSVASKGDQPQGITVVRAYRARDGIAVYFPACQYPKIRYRGAAALHGRVHQWNGREAARAVVVRVEVVLEAVREATPYLNQAA